MTTCSSGAAIPAFTTPIRPIPAAKRNWGWFETFIVWANDVQSLFGYTLAASLFLT